MSKWNSEIAVFDTTSNQPRIVWSCMAALPRSRGRAFCFQVAARKPAVEQSRELEKECGPARLWQTAPNDPPAPIEAGLPFGSGDIF